jgi:protein phosphatase
VFENFHPISSDVVIDIGAASDCGRVRSHNSDNYLALRLSRLQETVLTSLSRGDLPPAFTESAYAMLVADGLGAGAAGARASRVALSTLAHLSIRYGRWNVRVGQDSAAVIVDQGEFFYRVANDAVLSASRADPRLANMSTSLTAAYIAGTDLFFAHVGHSRGFLFRDGALIQLTTDDTMDEQAAKARLQNIERSKLDLHHVVVESIGGRPGGPSVEIEHVQLLPADRVLLCTNGLTDVVTDDQISNVLALQRNPEDDCRRLVDLALDAGGPDNVTVLSAEYRLRAAEPAGADARSTSSAVAERMER